MTFGVDGVTVRFGDIAALDDVSLAVPRGEVTAVVGADGAGKTTLLRTLAGLVEPVAGTIRRPRAEQIGYLPTGAGSWKNLTVSENVSFVGAYAINLTFAPDGHSTGIYPFTLLRELGEAPTS